MKALLLLFLFFISNFLYGQQQIKFKEPLKLIATDRINSDIKKDTPLLATGLIIFENDFNIVTVLAKTLDGTEVQFDIKKIQAFSFSEIDNVDKAWDRCKYPRFRTT